ncbi:MAG: Ig-like domain-containing protein [Bacteroidetes bacterium]|nr:Ig-like domain-containing protein [Bacteroidota bacterium]
MFKPVGAGALVLLISMYISGCANIIPPGGGPRDSLPPKLVIALPKDSATNVHTKNFMLSFDEYVTLQGIQENLIVSPTVKNTPIIDYKLKNVTIKFKDSLEENTTYTLDFGKAIVDVNESNMATGFRYIFSTGSTIDNGSYSGRVVVAATGKVDSTLIVVLHNNVNDTSIYKNAPRYYTRVNGKGNFSFKNLAPGTYAAYVIPTNFSRKYDDSTNYFGFLNNHVVVSEQTKSDTIYAFEEVKKIEKRIYASTNNKDTKEDKRLKYQASFNNGEQDLLTSLDLTFAKKIILKDSAAIKLVDTNFVSKEGYTLTLDSAATKLSIGYNWPAAEPFKLLVPKGSVTDSLGNTTAKSDTLSFYTKRETDYGLIKFKFPNIDTLRNPVLQITERNEVVNSYPLTSNQLVIKRYKPGSYDLRILFDANKNGVWDTGSFKLNKRQPEIVIEIPKPISVRNNWDNEITVSW